MRGGGQMAILVSLLYSGGGEVWEPEGNGYTRLTTTLCLWSVSICRGVSVARIQHQGCLGVVRWLYSSHYSMVGVVRCGNQKVIGTFDSLLLYGSRYVSEILAAIGLCLYGGMCQIR